MADINQSTSAEEYATSGSTGESNQMDTKLEFSKDEETLIARMFSLVGPRWVLIAGRIPGRSAEEIKKYWTSRYWNSQ